MELHKFPEEIIKEITFWLSIKDMRNLYTAYSSSSSTVVDITWYDDSSPGIDRGKYNSILECCVSRHEYSSYLGYFFTYPSSLLKQMLFNNVYLCGSRAESFFVPGSSYIDSDFNFYIENNKDKIFNFMKYMESIGIKWIGYDHSLSSKIFHDFKETLNKIQDHCTLSNRDIEELYYYKKHNTMKQYMATAIDKLYICVHDTFFSEGTELTVRDKNGNDKDVWILPSIYHDMKRIHGTFPSNDRIMNINLTIVDKKDSVNPLLDTVLNFGMSASQCGITGFGAFHMYSSEAYEMKSINWDTFYYRSKTESDDTENNIAKHKNKGYNIIRMSKYINSMNVTGEDMICMRIIGDKDSEIISLKPSESVSGQEYNYRLRKLEEMTSYSWKVAWHGLSTNQYIDSNLECILNSHLTIQVDKITSMITETKKKYTSSEIIDIILSNFESSISFEGIRRYTQKFIDFDNLEINDKQTVKTQQDYLSKFSI